LNGLKSDIGHWATVSTHRRACTHEFPTDAFDNRAGLPSRNGFKANFEMHPSLAPAEA
jgi:hypothetical protein